jgi:hypothetical protein
MNITILYGLPFITASIRYNGRVLNLENVLLDTGSASSIFHVDRLMAIDLVMEPNDLIRRIRGVGGTEFVFSKKVDALAVGDLHVERFEIEVGAMDYGFNLDGIIGLDFLRSIGAKIDLGELTIS